VVLSFHLKKVVVNRLSKSAVTNEITSRPRNFDATLAEAQPRKHSHHHPRTTKATTPSPPTKTLPPNCEHSPLSLAIADSQSTPHARNNGDNHGRPTPATPLRHTPPRRSAPQTSRAAPATSTLQPCLPRLAVSYRITCLCVA